MEEKKAIAISLVTASETDIEQTESRLVICGRCGVIDLLLASLNKSNSIWNFRTVEGDSPVDISF